MGYASIHTGELFAFGAEMDLDKVECDIAAQHHLTAEEIISSRRTEQ